MVRFDPQLLAPIVHRSEQMPQTSSADTAAMGQRPCGSLGYLAAPEKRTDGIAERIYFLWYGYVATPAGSERPIELLSVVILVPLG